MYYAPVMLLLCLLVAAHAAAAAAAAPVAGAPAALGSGGELDTAPSAKNGSAIFINLLAARKHNTTAPPRKATAAPPKGAAAAPPAALGRGAAASPPPAALTGAPAAPKASPPPTAATPPAAARRAVPAPAGPNVTAQAGGDDGDDDGDDGQRSGGGRVPVTAAAAAANGTQRGGGQGTIREGDASSWARGPAAGDQCTPFKVPAQFTGLQQFCEYLSKDEPARWAQAFRDAPPGSPGRGFPLRGCVVGCLVGDSLPNKVGALPWNSGSWSGKCFDDFAPGGQPAGVVNILTAGQQLRSWSNGMEGVLAYRGDITLDRSPIDGKPSWYINYKNAEPFLGRSLNGFVDEMREVAPGMIVGKVYIRPNTLPYNPTPFEVPSVTFALFQTCSVLGGGYATRPLLRAIP